MPKEVVISRAREITSIPPQYFIKAELIGNTANGDIDTEAK
jgi:hypothetical protein